MQVLASSPTTITWVIPSLQPEIQVGVGEAALPPMLFGDDVARLRREVGVPFAAPFAAREVVLLHDASLGGVWMVPVLIVARLPPPVWDDDNLNARRSYGAIQPAQVIKKPDLSGDRLEARINLPALGQKVVVRIDEEQCGPFARVGGFDHWQLLGPQPGQLQWLPSSPFPRPPEARRHRAGRAPLQHSPPNWH
jgi:hypothetical protein